MKPLSDLLEEHHDQIGRRLHLGNVHRQRPGEQAQNSGTSSIRPIAR